MASAYRGRAEAKIPNILIYGPILTFEVSKYSYLKNNRGLLKTLFGLRSNNGLSVQRLRRGQNSLLLNL